MSGRRTVVVVDDDRAIREVLSDVLTDEGYDVVCAGDGLEALRYLRAHPPPSLILLDWMMPRCDGPTFRAAQLGDPALAEIPVVILSADRLIAEKARHLRTTGVLQKPVQLSALLETIERCCA
jgi:CheY-like chemotaxis protein